ncbi:MAG: hypothetical protein B6230_03065 [Desulfobacteraceae bacterium 4572_89]|nr:MAG: hypothetical protein B6230_03065 [Desulfobacteraceae bacterium 4572_89]
MSDSQWTKQGGTFSHKNACKEFGLSEDEIIDAMEAGKLQYRQNYAHGNPYFRVLRKEVEALAKELHGNEGVKEQEVKFKLKKINREINSLKRKLSSLEKQKIELLESQKQIKT